MHIKKIFKRRSSQVVSPIGVPFREDRTTLRGNTIGVGCHGMT